MTEAAVLAKPSLIPYAGIGLYTRITIGKSSKNIHRLIKL